jgi:hypothetical protein
MKLEGSRENRTFEVHVLAGTHDRRTAEIPLSVYQIDAIIA